MLEIELKARCGSHDRMRAALEAAGAVRGKTVREADQYFNHPSRDFKESNEALRLRMEDDQCCITYKGPRLGGIAKSRFEAQTDIGDLATMTEILDKLGFVKSGTVTKTRELYALGDITICLDDVETLGTFIELEKLGEDKDAIEHELIECAASLGITEFERRSYLTMVLKIAGAL
jgi:adenylate cyclase class 2